MLRSDEIEKKLSELPEGYVTHRKINGKTYHYRQWTEGGRQHSVRIPDDEVEILSREIEERKSLEKELKALKGRGIDRKSAPGYATNVSTGEPLAVFAESAAKYRKRDCYGMIRDYVYGETSDRVCVLYGLRRTGKTTLIKQIINDFDSTMFSRSAYIKCRTSDTVAALNGDMIRLRDRGFKYIFIDEVTLLSDFIDSASLFSDVYSAQGMKIVLSGTDSLGFHLAVSDELYDRAVTVHTTYIPFREHSRLLGIEDTDEYIRYGGTLRAGELDFASADVNASDASFRDDESTRHYIDTAISENIQRSLECCRDGRYFRALRSLYEKDELTSAINRIIEDMNHSFTVKVMTSLFKSHDLRSASQLLRSERDEEKRTDILDRTDTTPIIEKLKEILSIKEKEEQKIGITEAHAEEIREYLKALDLIESVTIENRYPGKPELNTVESYIIFTQPGMRFCQAEALVWSVLSDPQINVLPPQTMKAIEDKITEDVMGRMLEDIVILETKKALEKRGKKVFRIRFSDGEFDMVVYDREKMTSRLYEIKHSKERNLRQYRHLANAEMVSAVEAVYGKVTERCVLYRGENHTEENGIEYRNVEEYLKRLGAV
jgi:hypothetical protein